MAMLFESDNRSKLQKMIDLVNHPNTPQTIRDVAIKKIAEMSPKKDVKHVKPTVKTPPPPAEVGTNVPKSKFNEPYIHGLTIGKIYEGLCLIQPKPYYIDFIGEGMIRFKVKGPFNISKQQYYKMIQKFFPTMRSISVEGYFGENEGYLIFMSFVYPIA